MPRHGDSVARQVANVWHFYALASQAELKAIGPLDRSDGQFFAVQGETTPWTFDADSAESASDDVLVPDAGTGRFKRSASGASIAAAAAGALQKRTVTITTTELDAAALTQAINIGATLPANARILGVDVRLATPFSGGSASAVSVDIGTSGDVDAIIDGANLFAAAVDGRASTRPLGIAPNKLFASAGAQLLATVISDVNVSLLTAGSVTIDVIFHVLA